MRFLMCPSALMALVAAMLSAAAAHVPADVSQWYTPGANQALAATDPAAIALWPGGAAPGERAGAIGAEYETCLTKGVVVPACKDRSIHNVTVPSITAHLAPGARARCCQFDAASNAQSG